jgi:hypothetical protein
LLGEVSQNGFSDYEIVLEGHGLFDLEILVEKYDDLLVGNS